MLAKHKFVFALPVLLMTLNSCGGADWKEIDRETFKSEVKGITDAPEIKSFTVDGIIASKDEKGAETKLEFKKYTVDPNSLETLTDEKALTITLIVGIFSAEMFAEGDVTMENISTPFTYYSGSEGWKVHAEEDKEQVTFVWNKYGLLTSIDDGGKNELNLKVAYEYKEAK